MKGSSSRWTKRKQLKLFLVGSISLYIFVWCYVLGYLSKAVETNTQRRSRPLLLTTPLLSAGGGGGDNLLFQHQQLQVQKQELSSSSKQQQTISNPWYGWQPKIKSMKCSWRKCFDGKVCI